MKRTVKIFLDDIRNPKECLSYMYKRIGAENPIYDTEWITVKNYAEFVTAIQLFFPVITHVSFDHDLADLFYTDGIPDSENSEHTDFTTEKTGYDCAVWMKKYYEINKKLLPTVYVHSMNPTGTQRIIDLFKTK